MYNARKAIQPKIRKNIDDVHNAPNDLKLTTNWDEQFLLVSDKVSNIIIFSTVENLKLLCSKNIIYVNETFKSVPKILTQMFTIHTMHNNLYVPLIFCLFKDKISQTYIRLYTNFSVINRRI